MQKAGVNFSLRQVRAFVAIAELGSFTRAASALHVSQPALTVQIRNLEDALATRLLDRDSRSVALTRAGRDLLPVLQRTLRDLDAAAAELRAAAGGHGGVVRIASLPSFAATLLPDVIGACRRENPGLAFVVRDAVAERVTAMVQDDEVDVGITGGAIPAIEVEVLQRIEDRLCVVYPVGHPLGARRRVRIDDLVDLPLVLTDPATSVRQRVEIAFASHGRRPIVACEATYMMTAVAMVRAGLGLTILPASAREIHIEPALVHRPIDGPAFVRAVSLVKRRGRTLSPACEAFVATCRPAMRALA